MRIECPSCTAVYELPDHLLAHGSRVLRCAACGKTWSVLGDGTARAAEPAAKPGNAADKTFADLMTTVVAAAAEETRPRPLVAEPAPQPEIVMATQVAESPAADTATQEPEPEAEAEAVPEEVPPAHVVAAAAAAAPPRPSFALMVAWLATLGGIGSLVVMFAFFPQGVVARWPAAARIYEAVGITIGAS